MITKPLTVVKCGGNPAVDATGICADIARLVHQGHSMLLVHGGSGEIGRLADRLGVAQQTLIAPDNVTTRYTDPDTLEVVVLALAGAIKPRLVAELSRQNVPAVGLTGMDGGMLRATRKSAVRAVVNGRTVVIRDNHSGRVATVHTELPAALLHAGYVPVISPPAIDDHDHPVNVDADRAAAALAAALGADQLLLLTAAPGVLADPDDPTSVRSIHQISPAGSVDPSATGGMALKLVTAREALIDGVATVRIADGRTPEPVSRALAGLGTTVHLAHPATPTHSSRDSSGSTM